MTGGRQSLYKLLGCPSVPRSEDIVAHIERLRERGEAPENPKILYTTLVQVLRMEGKAPDIYDNHVILWAEGAFHIPSEVLVGRGYHKIFRGVVPQIIGSSGYLKAARNLGAHSSPEPSHWRKLLHWFSSEWGGANPLPYTEQDRLRQVYTTLPALPEGISENVRFLLGTNGRLYSQAEAVKGLLLINDDPRLASEIEACKSAVAFADSSKPGSLGLFTEAGVKNITAVRRLICTYVGEIVATGGRVDVDTALRTIQSDEFGSALSRLVDYNVGAGQGYEQLTPLELLAELKRRSSIAFVDKLQAVYTVAGQTVNVDQEIVLEDERFVSIRASSNVELRDRLSFALASLVTEEPLVQRPLADSIFRLLASGSPKDMERYLKGRGIPWEFDGGSKSEHWEDNSMEPDIDQLRWTQ